ncbi:hypothetical protein C2E20_3081 [Micractinium conductrix]|uniref:Tryptophan-rich sensory protein n=1 Tax=Micractinium conductrix TaxID=554055 RepID=A0A2P6VHK5_9CHLO|nr:hypothetical protein C2E20_3081 [Micractinium conductrix]|eukprot:PSC73558.1 hypothetical protein C2E20_3081 [Micractinium conductrix]
MDIFHSSSQAPSRNLRTAVLATYAAFIVVNVVSSAGWLGATNAEVSAKFAVPLTPAGWAFSIWGAIFLLEGYGAVLQAMGAGYDADGFKFAFVQQTPGGMWLAFVLILTAFMAMGRAMLQLYSVKDRFGPAPNLSLYAAFFLGTSINTAWLSVATAVQLIIALKMGVHDLEVPSVLAAAAVTCLGVWVLFREHDTAYGLTLVWALVAVYEQTQAPAVSKTALAAVIVLAVLSIASVLRRPGPPPQYETFPDHDAHEPLRPAAGDEP